MRRRPKAHGSTDARPLREERRRRKRSSLLGMALAFAAIAGVMLFTPAGPDQPALLSLNRSPADPGMSWTASARQMAERLASRQ